MVMVVVAVVVRNNQIKLRNELWNIFSGDDDELRDENQKKNPENTNNLSC